MTSLVDTKMGIVAGVSASFDINVIIGMQLINGTAVPFIDGVYLGTQEKPLYDLTKNAYIVHLWIKRGGE